MGAEGGLRNRDDSADRPRFAPQARRGMLGFRTVTKEHSMPAAPAPASFTETMNIPAAELRTAVAVKNDTRTVAVTVTFRLRGQTGAVASYAATCPRCNSGEIEVEVPLAADGSFAEAPACPTLCLACEDRLDQLMEPGAKKTIGEQPGDRETLDKYLKAMNLRAWD